MRAAVETAVAGGLSGASVAAIASRAGLSQGTIYLYFPTKDALLREAFMDVKRRIHARIMDAASGAPDTRRAIETQWHALFEFVSRHPDDYAFAEQVSAARLPADWSPEELEAMAADLRAVVERGIADGALRPAPPAVILTVLSAPAAQLARRAALDGVAVDRTVLDETFELIWRGIAAEGP